MAENNMSKGSQDQIEPLNITKLTYGATEATDSEQEHSDSSLKARLIPSRVSLKKELTLINGVGFVVGQIIGSGIFITPSIILAFTESFGLSMVTWLVGAVIALTGSLCYCELGTFLQKCGGDYDYILKAYSFKKKKPSLEFLGSLLAFLYTWASTFILRPTSIGIITLTFGRYLSRPFYIGCDIPIGVVKLFSLSAITSLAIVNSYSVKLTARLMTTLAFTKLVTCAFVIILGIGKVIAQGCLPPHFHHPFEGTTNSPAEFALALYAVLWAYDGWNVVNYAVEEMKNVERNLPRSMLIAVPIVAMTYLLVNFSFFAVLSYDDFDSADAVALPFAKAIIGTAGLVIIPLLVALATFGTANGSLYIGSRVIFSSARDGLLPKALSGVHRTSQTPVPAVIFQASATACLVAIANVEDLIDGFSFATWLIIGITMVGLIIMRVTHSKEPRPYKVWIILPIFMVFTCLYLVILPIFQKPVPSLTAFGVILLGVPVYIFLVMETPWRLRPKTLDKISRYMTTFVNDLLNTESPR